MRFFSFQKVTSTFLWGLEGKSFALGSVVHLFLFYFLTPKTLNINWKIKMGHKKATYRVCLVHRWLRCTSPQPQWRWCYMVSLWVSGLPRQQSNYCLSSPYMSSWRKQCLLPSTISFNHQAYNNNKPIYVTKVKFSICQWAIKGIEKIRNDKSRNSPT